jgi:glycosyltransferase involved in cell wall biosynthesis
MIEPVRPGPLRPLPPGPSSSVVIGVPVRNGGAILELALKSLTDQTHSNLEIIISDNASTDQTAEICERFARQDSRIRYIRQSVRLSAEDNFRFVFERTESDWFLWAAHDDLRDQNYLEVLLRGFAAHPSAALVFTDTVIFSDPIRRTPVGQLSGSPSSTGPSAADRHRRIVQNGATKFYGLFRSDVVRAFRWPKLPIGHDWMLLHWAVTLGEVVYQPGSTFWYFVRPEERRTAAQNLAYRAYHGLGEGLRASDIVRFPPDVKWAFGVSRELAYARRARGVDARRWRTFLEFCFLQHGGARAWAKQFAYLNAPAPVRSAWTAMKHGQGRGG